MRFLESLKSAGTVHHGNNYLWSMMKKSSISRMQKFMYSQMLCYVLEWWIRTQHQILFGNDSWVGSKVHHNTELGAQLTENQWNSSGIFSQVPPHCRLFVKSKSSWTQWANQINSKDEISSCRCSMTSYREVKTMKWNVLLIPHLCLCSQKEFQQDVGHSSDVDQKRSGFPLLKKDLEENGIKSLNWWWPNSEKGCTQFSEPRVRCLEERSKAKDVEKYLFTSLPMRIRLPELDTYWKSQPVTYKVNTEWKLELNLWTKTILTRGSEFLMTWTHSSQTWTEVFAYASCSKSKAKPRRPSTTCSSTRTVPIRERIWIDIGPGAQSDQAHPVAKRLTLFFGTEN